MDLLPSGLGLWPSQWRQAIEKVDGMQIGEKTAGKPNWDFDASSRGEHDAVN